MLVDQIFTDQNVEWATDSFKTFKAIMDGCFPVLDTFIPKSNKKDIFIKIILEVDYVENKEKQKGSCIKSLYIGLLTFENIF